jgi:isopenicillin-N N-acyltransferase-like protein
MIGSAHELYPWEGPMPTLQLEGSPREIGRKHGQACSRWIGLIAEDYWQAMENPPIALPHEVILDGIKQIETLIVEYTDEAYLEEMRGLAEGAGLTYEDVFVANCGFDLMVSRTDAAVRAEMFSKFERLTTRCASFVAWGRATEGARIIGTHNNDGPRFPAQFQVTMIVKPEEGFPFISASTVGKLGQHSMMNGQGLLVVGTALDNGTKEKVEEPGVPLDIIFRHIAQRCSSTAEAVETLNGLPLAVAGNFVFADRSRDVELVQATPFFRASVKPGPERDYLHVSNHALVEEIKPYLSLRDLSSTHYRYETMGRDLESNYGHITEDVAKEIMSSHFDWSVQETHPCENSPCRHHEYKGELGGTNRCTVWDLDALTVQVALGNPCKAQWVSVSGAL